ncbi:MAG TPA: GNAT family N-acetyltransferase, partial [Dongiaceae bacterium]|nr:GNAT family N-acetyltransferase [Dongiaceae bacterium]
MLRIRRVPDDLTPTNAAAVAQAQAILRQQFPLARESEFTSIPDQLRDPFKKRLQTLLFVAEDAEDRVKGLALLMHAPDLHFVYLDYLAAHPGRAGSGIGAALYERVRETAAELDAIGVFLECLPDDPALCRDPDVLKQNADRLRFYERFGARPIIGTTYEMPIEPGADNPPYLVFDGLGHETPLRRREAQAIVRALLDRKYRELCPPGYIEMVVASFTDDPVQLRPLRYLRGEPKAKVEPLRRTGEQIPLVINDRHDIHHV